MPTTSLFKNSCSISKKVEAASCKTFNKSGQNATTNKKRNNITVKTNLTLKKKLSL
jgi:hypothetical protein